MKVQNSVNGAISKLEALIKPNSAEVSFKTDKHEPITKVIDLKTSDAKETKTINLEIDKLKNTTLLFNLRMENLHSGSNFPQKVEFKVFRTKTTFDKFDSKYLGECEPRIYK